MYIYQSPRACSYIINCCYSCFRRTRLKDGEISSCYLTFALYRNWKLERLRWRGQWLSQMTKKQNGGKWSFFALCRVKRVGRRKSVHDDTRPVLYTEALPWRSSHVTRFFNQLDHKVGKNTTKRAKLQTLPRVPGPVSTHAKPTAADFPPNHWGFVLTRLARF